MVRPLGNALLGNALVSSCGLFSLLNHQLLAQLITDLPVVCIAKLAQTCKTLMCFAGLESLWRSKYLLEYSGLEFIGSWKRSFIIQYANKDVTTKCEIGSQNVYSDHLYLIERCLHADLNTICNPTHDNIDRASNLTVSQFIEQYSIPNKPVIITDLVKTWKAHSKWTTEYLLETLGGNGKKKFQAESCNLSFSQYHKYMKSCNEEAPLYLFDKDFCKDTDLGGDFTTPDIFSHNDFFGVLGETRPDYQWLIIGPERSASTFHIDPNSTSAWNAVITGKKKWILYPPHMIPPGVYPHENGSYVTSPLSLPEWYLSFYNASDFSKGKGPIECVCSAGEIIFVPNNWWHAVINLEGIFDCFHYRNYSNNAEFREC